MGLRVCSQAADQVGPGTDVHGLRQGRPAGTGEQGVVSSVLVNSSRKDAGHGAARTMTPHRCAKGMVCWPCWLCHLLKASA